MTTEREEPGQRNGQKLDDIVQDADEYYNYLKEKHVQQTRLDAIIVSLTVWFGAFVALGVGAYTTIQESALIGYLLAAFLASIAIAIGAGFATFIIRRRRAFKFTELGVLVAKVKQGGASLEDGLHLMDAMHQAAFKVRKRRLTSAFEYGIVGFAIVTILGLNAGIRALAGVVVYLYFRYEALREYERGEKRYENSKRALLQSPLIRLGASRPVCPRPIPGHTLLEPSPEKDESTDETRSKLSTIHRISSMDDLSRARPAADQRRWN